MAQYDPAAVESRWQARWADAGIFECGSRDPGRESFFCLEMLPYPSGKLHMGHVRNYSIGDAVARFQAMSGRQVLHVLGWDAFGLPAENAAIKHGVHPRQWTLENIETMRRQAQRLGWGYDWSREIATCLPEYYRWNQWLFLRMLERGIAYRASRLLNWCKSCGTVLANEQVHDGRCWRCDSAVVMREFEQWFLRTSDYAEELLDGLDDLDDWPDRVRLMQRNWIGRSQGAQVRFRVEGADTDLEVFTTRVDTIFGATYVALAAEHPELPALIEDSDQRAEVESFIEAQRARTLEDRFADAAEKIGVFTGRYAINPYSGERVPVWVANFVLMDVGTGAIMSVPAHDDRDFAFAHRYGIPIRPVIRPADGDETDAASMSAAYTSDGVLYDSGPYDGLTSVDARARMTQAAVDGGFGEGVVTYRLRDWGVSRQRFWGTPIPVVHCPSCGIVGVPQDQLPVVLPEDLDLGGPGGSSLANSPSFAETTCPSCGEAARRDTDTMDTFVDSCWYYFRYVDPHNDDAPFDRSLLEPWFPVDLYIGGIEHATMHLIYTRFWTKVMRDLGLVAIDEPVDRLFTQGMVIKDGAKMSKSKGNVVDPDDMVARYGADTTRLFSLFAAPPERELEWSDEGIEGCHRFLKRLWRTFDRVVAELPAGGEAAPADAADGTAIALRRKAHRTIARVTHDLGPRMHFNTAVSALMELCNAIAPVVDRGDDRTAGETWAVREAFDILARLLAPLAPHLAEELWAGLGHEPFVSVAPWPTPDEALLVDDEVLVVVQVNGKLRARLRLPKGADRESAETAARAEANVAAQIEGKTVRKVIHVPDRLLNMVVG